MACGLELRSPFLDHRIVELGLSLPSQYKIHHLESKRILRDILEIYLPRKYFDRPKKGFGIPRSEWMRNELRELIYETLNNPSFREQKLFNEKNLSEMIRQHNSGKNLDRIIWPIFMFALWFRFWVD